jgi:DNA replication protein DnaC
MGEMIYDGRGIDGVLIREAGTCQFMDSASNVVIEGCTGTGKSYLAYCLAKQACKKRRSARYVRLPDLLMERDELAATERSNAKILKKYARYELLVIDEWLTEDVDDVDISFLFELIERRYAAKSTVLCTQYTPVEWHGRLGGGVQADAMVDRLVHGAVRIDLGDVNVRKLLAEKR